jgi:pimeloyl-ACP methyl ester carboxylesterase
MGSLYALACAHALPARVERLSIVGGLAPTSVAGVNAGMAATSRALFDMARTDPRALRLAMAPLAGSPAGLRATMAASAPAADQALLASRAAEFEADYAESLRRGIEGIACDFELAAGEWPFPLAEIQTSVDLWCGAQDCNTPPAMTRYLASVLPHQQLFELPDAGHYCLYSYWSEILDRLTAINPA